MPGGFGFARARSGLVAIFNWLRFVMFCSEFSGGCVSRCSAMKFRTVAFRDFVENYSRQVSVEDILNSGDVEKTSEFTINEHCALIEKMEASDVFNSVLTELQISNLATYFVNLDSEPAMKLWAVIGKGERDNVINLHKAEASDGNKVGHRLVELLTGNNN